MDFLIRSVRPADFPGVFRLARHLDSYNLPADRRLIRRLIADSVRSFADRLAAPEDGRYLFVLEDLKEREIVGCSLIVAKHGRPGMPHLYMNVFTESFTSRTLKKTVRHQALRLGATEDGPTELGGLVLLPAYRGRPERFGAWLSYARLLYIAAHIDRFQANLLAEYLPRFLKGGVSPFWEYMGRKFTGLPYKTADRLSISNKEFILSLFPRSTVYMDFFPPEVLKYLGEVGDPSKPAARLLAQAGFRYLRQIEPFDGGPYHGAQTREAGPVRAARQLQCRALREAVDGRPHMLMLETAGAVRMLGAPLAFRGGRAELPAGAAAALGLRAGDWFWATPLP